MDITLKKIKVLDNRFIFAVECQFCKSLANEFNTNNEPVCPQHAEHSAHLTGGTVAPVEELQAIVDAEQSVHLTVLPVREIETVCPHCSLVFDVPVPEPHSK